MTASALGIDLGGTKVAIMRVAEDGTIQERTRIATDHSDAPEVAITQIATAARPLLAPDTTRVGLGAAALIGTGGVLRFGPNLGWQEIPIADLLEKELQLPVMVDNDANVAAWGEFRHGAGAGSSNLLCVTVGTGIGGGLVLDGRLFRGANGFAGEIGHTILDPDGPPCACGNHGCWEQVASGTAIQRAGQAQAAADPSGAIGKLAGGDPGSITGQEVTQAAQGGDAAAIAIMNDVGQRLGQGIAGLANALDPDRIVIGGGASEAGDLLLDPTTAAFSAALLARDHRPEIPLVVATLGNDAGAIGAALLALEGEDAVWGGS